MNQDRSKTSNGQLVGLILLAYAFSFLIRMIWVFQVQGYPGFFWNDQLMINTNDGYYFASGAQKVLFGLHENNPRVPDLWAYGVVFFTTLFAKITPLSLETIILYMPAVISSLVVIPIILISRLYHNTLWGFFAALLASITWSYYNRTMVGYYDTDMFSAMVPMFILYFLIKVTQDFQLKTALYGAVTIAIYPFLYDSGLSIVYAIGITYALYMIIAYPKKSLTYSSLILIFISLSPFPFDPPLQYILKITVLIIVYTVLQKTTIEQKKLLIITVVLFLIFLIFGNVLGRIFTSVSHYLATGTKTEGLHFYSVAQTVREAGKIPFSVFANRISGSIPGLIVAAVGYGFLVWRKRAFILTLPLVGIGIFALFGGLRFTVYAVPVAAMSAIYLFFVIGEFFRSNFMKFLFIVIATAGMIYPNIIHIIAYQVPTVLNRDEVKDLVDLDQIADEKDYTLAWWDYGYPIWFYSDTNTLIDGGKHHNDNFIISKIMQTDSAQLAANLSRLAVETYVDSNYSIVADTIFRNGEEEQVDPNLLLVELQSNSYILPKKTRDIYLYLPYRMLNIFPTVAVFGNLDLNTGKKEREMVFYPARATSNQNGVLRLSNGLVLDIQKGELLFGKDIRTIRQFIVVQTQKNGEIALRSQNYDPSGAYSVVYMQSYGQFVVMDNKTLHSMYVQMFILGKYDKDLFELVVSSPYSRIYRLKR
jgi:dolichyl-diphosphooligosaccharide--protein glycosyltransferase/undecaprenyl-diphosphooligosaccharide--protein glycosyltransferase